MRALLLTALLLGGVAPILAPEARAADAPATKLGVVDFQRALNEVAEGQQARARLETLHAGKKGEIERLKKAFETQLADYEKQKLVLSEAALRQKQQELTQLQAQAEGAAAAAEQEMQKAYYGAMETIIGKMKVVAGELAKERGLAVVLESNGDSLVWSAPGLDLTDEVIKRYNAANPVEGAARPAAPAPKK
jgi:outer membrane protein